jgi:hypothetical protein
VVLVVAQPLGDELGRVDRVFVSGPPVELTLIDSLVARNTLLGGSGIERRGGGLFTTEPVTLTRTRLAGNVPDQCFGCSP